MNSVINASREQFSKANTFQHLLFTCWNRQCLHPKQINKNSTNFPMKYYYCAQNTIFLIVIIFIFIRCDQKYYFITLFLWHEHFYSLSRFICNENRKIGCVIFKCILSLMRWVYEISFHGFISFHQNWIRKWTRKSVNFYSFSLLFENVQFQFIRVIEPWGIFLILLLSF